MMELTVFFQQYNEQYGEYTDPWILFFRNNSPDLIGLGLVFLVLFCIKELYTAFRLDKITKNTYNEEKEGDAE